MNIATKIIRRLDKKQAPEIYLDIVSVVPRKDFKRHFEYVPPKKSDKILYGLLDKHLPFPYLSEVNKVDPNSLVLDIAVTGYQTGTGVLRLVDLSIIFWLVPIFWRPKIQLRSRLYKFGTKKIIAEYRIKKSLSLKYFLTRPLPKKNITDIAIEDTQVLLYNAIKDLKGQINKFFL